MLLETLEKFLIQVLLETLEKFLIQVLLETPPRCEAQATTQRGPTIISFLELWLQEIMVLVGV